MTVGLDGSGLKPGDVAGMVLSRTGRAWVGLERGEGADTLIHVDERGATAARIPVQRSHVSLRAECDFLTGTVRFSCSLDGARYDGLGEPLSVSDGPAQSRGVRCSLFSCSARPDVDGGSAEFDSFIVTWP